MLKAGLYIHIPFCIQKCSYCDFFSVKAGQYSDILIGKETSLFALSVVKDIDIQAKKYGINEWDSVYIGGGTPSLLSPNDLYFISSHILNNQKRHPKEFTIEINPEDLNKEVLSAVLNGGVNRISVGIQSLSDEVLRACKRRGSRAKSISSLNLIRTENNLSLSCDLIAGLKYQTETVLKDDLETLLNFKPEHLSLYALCSNTEAPFEKEDEIASLWLYGKSLLERNSYNKYEVSNFSYKNLYRSIHNEKYWKLKNYVGVGPGAFGSIFFDKSKDSPAHAVRFSAVKNIHKWLYSKNRDEVYEYESIGEKELIEETFMMGLRLTDGLDCRFFKSRFGKNIMDIAGKTILKWQSKNMAVLNSEKLYLTENGLLYLNIFLQEVFDEIDNFFC